MKEDETAFMLAYKKNAFRDSFDIEEIGFLLNY